MVERRGHKRDCVVAVRAVRRGKCRSRGRVHGIVGPLPSAAIVGIQVALGVSAIGRADLQVVVVIDMAVAAGIHFARRSQLMRIGQWETRRVVIEIGIEPRIHVVATGAGGTG